MGRQTYSPQHEAIHRARWDLLRHVDELLHGPMIVLSFIWLGLLILDFSSGLNTVLTGLTYAIWAIFVLDFLLEFGIAPHKLTYLRTHWLTAIALVLPALRIFTLFRALQILRATEAARSVGLVRVLTSLNRGMGALAVTLGRRGIGFIVAFTAVVTLVGAAGMAYFESPASLRAAGYSPAAQLGSAITSYWQGLWWTAMAITTMGSEYWPKTIQERILAFLLAVYAFTVFGYITATIASHFVRVDTEGATASASDTQKEAEHQVQQALAAHARETSALRMEVAALRAQIAELSARPESRTSAPSEREPAQRRV